MAIFIKGMPCGLCGKPITDSNKLVAFPAFLGPDHPYHRYSDGVFHDDCFEQCSDRDELLKLLQRYDEIWKSRPRDLKSLDEINAWGSQAFREFDGPRELTESEAKIIANIAKEYLDLP